MSEVRDSQSHRRIGCSACYSSSEAAASGGTPTKPRHKEGSCAGEEVVKARA